MIVMLKSRLTIRCLFYLATGVATLAHGLAKLPTGPQSYFSPAYNHDVSRLAFDPELLKISFE